ncbi:MAG TPA: nucleotidyltransferase domain-containing protein [Devosia sp.]|jgi:predicted nucleotidyltransferase|nr:nucleotidyltransferase domain-containing protein [Devosia sp.]
MDQQQLIAAIGEHMADKQAVRGLFLSGSFGRGTADEWSDVDLVALAAPEDHAAVARDWRKSLEAITPIVFWQELPRGGLLLNAVSHEWLRCDLIIVEPARFGSRAKNTVKPLVDRDGVYDALPETLPPRQPDPATVSYLIHEFIRMLGLMPVGLGRREYVTMVLGVGMMRGHLETLLMQDVTAPDPGGILHQSKLLSPDDMQMLQSLPYPGPEREALIEANLAIARQFMPRARAMAERLAIAWPETFEAATRRRLALTLGDAVAQGW